jgi:hypothetical protein
MKSIFLMTGFLFIAVVNCFSQNLILKKNDEAKSQKQICGFLSSDSKLTSLNGNNTRLFGGAFGVEIKHRTRIGLGGYSLRGKNMFEYLNPLGDNKEYQLNNEFEYFGLFFEYVVLPDAPIHITIPVLLGGGKATIKQEVPLNQLSFPGSEGIEETYWATVEKCNLSVIEPGMNVELEMLSWMNLDLGASYRFVMGSELKTIPNSARNFSGASFHLGLNFSCF